MVCYISLILVQFNKTVYVNLFKVRGFCLILKITYLFYILLSRSFQEHFCDFPTHNSPDLSPCEFNLFHKLKHVLKEVISGHAEDHTG